MVASHICCFGCAPESRQACLDWSWVASWDLWESFTSQLSSTREPLPPTRTHSLTPPSSSSVVSLKSLSVWKRLVVTRSLSPIWPLAGRRATPYQPPHPPFPQEMGPISGVPLHSSQLHKLFVLLFWWFRSVGETACQLKVMQRLIWRSAIPHLKVYFGSFLFIFAGKRKLTAKIWEWPIRL